MKFIILYFEDQKSFDLFKENFPAVIGDSGRAVVPAKDFYDTFQFKSSHENVGVFIESEV